MREKTIALTEKAANNLRIVEVLIEEDAFEIAVSRAYYAMFYVAEALLYEIGLSFSSHRAVIAAFGKYFAKTKILDPKYHQYLVTAFELRNVGDYDVGSEISRFDVVDTLANAGEFYDAARTYLKTSGE